MARNNNTSNNNPVIDEEKNVITEEKKNQYVFVDIDGTESMIDYDSIPEKEKNIVAEEFKAFVAGSSFDSIAHNMKWNAPHIGMHEDGKLHIFHSEKNVPVKKYVVESFSDIQLASFKNEFRNEVRICKNFLSDIASGKGINDVKAVKEALNNINRDYLKINLVCTNEYDEEYTLSCTNTIVRVRLIDKARANKLSSGFKSIKIVDIIAFFIEALASEYRERTSVK